MTDIPVEILGKLDWEITEQEQLEICKAVKNQGNIISLRHVGKDGWISLPVRRPVDPRFNANNYRMVKGVEWEWIDNPITDLVKNITKRVEHLYDFVTRVTLLLQRPGATVAMHRDPVFGNDYGDGNGPYNIFNAAKDIPVHNEHANNNFLSLKGPLTEIPGDNGCPVIRYPENGKDYQYNAGRNFFLINEIDALHGARACGHHRGVMWIDGWFNRDQLLKVNRTPIDLIELEGQTVSTTTPWTS